MKFRSRKHSQDGPSASQLFVYYAARDGFAKLLSSALMDSSADEIPQLVEQDLLDSEGQCMAPLIISSKNGHKYVVKILTSSFGANLEKECCVMYEDIMIERATALWCAAAGGHLDVVKTLVHRGANVNHVTGNNSTPVRVACVNGRLDIIRFLVDHGADLTISNQHNNTCLMIASTKGHLELVRYLLDIGMDANVQANNGSTALLFASERGNLEVVKELLLRGASMCCNNKGTTPALAAAERANAEIVEHFVEAGQLSLEDEVNAFELLGASFANDNRHYCLYKAFKYLLKGMERRSTDIGVFLPKPYRNPVPAYENWVESQNVHELESIRNNENALHMESLTIRERILGSYNPEVVPQIIFRGAVFAENGRYDRCLELWSHALELTRGRYSIRKHLLRFGQVFSDMLFDGLEVSFHTVSYILRAAVKELQCNKTKLDTCYVNDDILQITDDIETNLTTTLYLLVIISKMLNERTPEEVTRTKKLIFRLQKLKLVTGNGQTLLHMCVNAETPVDIIHPREACRFPSPRTAKLLIECGADLDALDDDRNSPLHIIVTYDDPSGYGIVHKIITDLLMAGAHLDIVNIRGETPLEASATVIAEVLLRTYTPLRLKCIAARTANLLNLPCDETSLPSDLLDFVDLHGPGYVRS